jgi:L-threonylcarbamoyladenylate synthase
MPIINKISQAIETLKEGRILAYPTETLWGLGVDIFNEKAISDLITLKKRSPQKAISIMVRDISQAKTLATISPTIEQLMEIFWPGPLTFVLPAKSSVSFLITGGMNFVGLRCSSLPFLIKLTQQYPNPITTTSANISGEKNALTMSDLKWLVLNQCDNWKSKPLKECLGSTIIKFENENVNLLRQGDISFSFVEKVVQSVGYKITSPK